MSQCVVLLSYNRLPRRRRRKTPEKRLCANYKSTHPLSRAFQNGSMMQDIAVRTSARLAGRDAGRGDQYLAPIPRSPIGQNVGVAPASHLYYTSNDLHTDTPPRSRVFNSLAVTDANSFGWGAGWLGWRGARSHHLENTFDRSRHFLGNWRCFCAEIKEGVGEGRGKGSPPPPTPPPYSWLFID